MKSFFIWLFRMTLTILAMLIIYAIANVTGCDAIILIAIIVMFVGIYWSFNQ